MSWITAQAVSFTVLDGKLIHWSFYIPAAPGALEALCHRGSPAGYRHPVPYDLADCGSPAHHSGGMAALSFCVFWIRHSWIYYVWPQGAYKQNVEWSAVLFLFLSEQKFTKEAPKGDVDQLIEPLLQHCSSEKMNTWLGKNFSGFDTVFVHIASSSDVKNKGSILAWWFHEEPLTSMKPFHSTKGSL